MHSDLLIELVRRYSPSTLEAPAVNYLVQWMRERGFAAEVDGAGNAFGIRGASTAPNTLMLLGHIDTFPGDIPVTLSATPPTNSPYPASHTEYLTGRGSVDAKGALCTFAEAAAQARIPEGWRVMVAGCVEEEIASGKGSHYISDHYTPTYCIIGEPSASNRITLGYKGRLLVEYTLKQTVAHTARPEPTVGELGSRFWQQIQQWAAQENAGVERIFDQVMPSLRAINTSSDYFYERLNMTVSFRLPPRVPPEQVITVLEGLKLAEGELRTWGQERAYQSDRSNPLVRGMMGAIRAQGGQPGFVLKTGTSDMNTVGAKWSCPMIAYGPGDSNLDHTPQEHLPLDEYDRAIATLIYLIENLERVA
jgi:[amino group carrier protein]-lysine/ornithine hydrolase